MIFLKIKIKLKNQYSKYLLWRELKSKDIFYLSLGENCLTDHLLARHKLKSFSTVFSNGRSNIDYALHLEKIKYKNFLEPNNLKHDFLNETKVVRSILINSCDEFYNDLHKNGFELTHHDVIDNVEHRKSIKRKIKRLSYWRKKKDIVFFYHHRPAENSNIEKLFSKCEEFTAFYSNKNIKALVIVFSQNIISTKAERRVEYKKINDTIHYFVLFTTESWSGDGDDFWAKNDVDLTQEMMIIAKQIAKTQLLNS